MKTSIVKFHRVENYHGWGVTSPIHQAGLCQKTEAPCEGSGRTVKN